MATNPIPCVSSLAKFAATSIRVVNTRQRVLFRGQARASWKLLPKLLRKEFDAHRMAHGPERGEALTLHDHEGLLREMFNRLGHPHLAGTDRADKWTNLAVAQHHGLATRLLDWSTNPLVALFFAIENAGERGDAVVYYLTTEWNDTLNDTNPAEQRKIGVVDPPMASPRIIAQAGKFTAHPLLPDADRETWPSELGRIVISANAKPNMRRQLFDIGINRAALFPDLDGAAAHANWLYSKLKDE